DYQELNINYIYDLICSQDRKGIAWLPEFEDMYYDLENITNEQTKWVKASCREKLEDGRFYWEVQWTGFVCLALKDGKAGIIGKYLKFICNKDQYSAIHEEAARMKTIYMCVYPRPKPGPETFGVYLDYPEGTLSFYRISSQGVNHLYTFHTTFNKPVIP
ncbi:finTRIM family, member 82, partial [Silurus asotus]